MKKLLYILPLAALMFVSACASHKDEDDDNHRQAVDENGLPCVALNLVGVVIAQQFLYLITLHGCIEVYGNRLCLVFLNLSRVREQSVFTENDAAVIILVANDNGVFNSESAVAVLGKQNTALIAEVLKLLGIDDRGHLGDGKRLLGVDK